MSRVHFYSEIMCVEMFVRLPPMSRMSSQWVEKELCPDTRNRGWLQAAGVPQHLQPNLLHLFWDATVYQIRKHLTDIFTFYI